MTGRPIGHQSTIPDPTEHDALQGQWGLRMVEKFRDRVTRAIESGVERAIANRREGAAMKPLALSDDGLQRAFL